MKREHTPGPWIVAEDQVKDYKGNVIADVTIVSEWNTNIGIVTTQMPWEANARLIAAAPKLLEMVKRLNSSLTRTNDDDQQLYLDAKKLIAKIEED